MEKNCMVQIKRMKISFAVIITAILISPEILAEGDSSDEILVGNAEIYSCYFLNIIITDPLVTINEQIYDIGEIQYSSERMERLAKSIEKHLDEEDYHDISIELDKGIKKTAIILKSEKDIGCKYWYEYDGLTISLILKPNDEIDPISLIFENPYKEQLKDVYPKVERLILLAINDTFSDELGITKNDIGLRYIFNFISGTTSSSLIEIRSIIKKGREKENIPPIEEGNIISFPDEENPNYLEIKYGSTRVCISKPDEIQYIDHYQSSLFGLGFFLHIERMINDEEKKIIEKFESIKETEKLCFYSDEINYVNSVRVFLVSIRESVRIAAHRGDKIYEGIMEYRYEIREDRYPTVSVKIDTIRETADLLYQLYLGKRTFNLVITSIVITVTLSIIGYISKKKSKFKFEKIENPSKILIYLFPILFSTSTYIILSEFNLFTNPENARYMLSALVQSEAAVIAIVITMNLIGIQLGAAYSPRVARIFSDSLEFRMLICSYIIAILYGLCILGIVESNNSVHIRISYSFGVYCFTALILYTNNMLNIVPSANIEKLSHKIKMAHILQGKNVIQPIMDIIKVSIKNSDEHTAEFGLNIIGDRIEEIFENEEFSAEEEREISKEIYEPFVRVGKFAMDKGAEDSAWMAVHNVERLGIKSCETGLPVSALRAAVSLSTLGDIAIRNGIGNIADQAVLRLFGIGEAAINNELPHAKAIVRLLDVAGNNAAGHGLENTRLNAIMWLEQLRETAEKKGNKDLVSYLSNISENSRMK